MNERPPPRAGADVGVLLDFWGCTTRVWVDHPDDAEYLQWFYRDHLCAAGVDGEAADVSVSLSTVGARGFFAACLGPDPKTVRVREGWGPWRVYERFGARSTLPTPLPPFDLQPLRSRVSLHHGAAVVVDDGPGCVVVTGASGSGKTSLTLTLAAQGARLLTDDLLVRRRSDGYVLPYGRPLTLRESVWAHLGDVCRLAGEHGLARRTPTGARVLHVRPDQAGIVMAREAEPIRLHVEVSPGPSIEYRRDGGRLLVRYDPTAGHLPAVAQHVREEARRAACR